MEFLVDGYNLLHAWDRDTVSPNDLESARTRLLDALATFSERTGQRVTAVFDGVKLPYPDKTTHRSVKVRFSRTPQDADRLIADLLGRSDHARDTTVVSSDNAVQNEAKAMGAKRMSSQDFAWMLRETPAPSPKPSGQTPALSDAEVQAWAKDFGVSLDAGMSTPTTPLKKKGRGR